MKAYIHVYIYVKKCNLLALYIYTHKHTQHIRYTILHTCTHAHSVAKGIIPHVQGFGAAQN